eukprot:6161928-Lingulodinium_polyedra.AAC.1
MYTDLVFVDPKTLLVPIEQVHVLRKARYVPGGRIASDAELVPLATIGAHGSFPQKKATAVETDSDDEVKHKRPQLQSF